MGNKAARAKGIVEGLTCSVNGMDVVVPSNSTVYMATLAALPEHHRVPTLCHHPYLPPDESCGICKVECDGVLLSACATPVTEGMTIKTDTPQVNANIQAVLKGMLASHPLDCPSCTVNMACTFQDLLAVHGVSPRDLSVAEQEDYLTAHEGLFDDLENYFGNFAVELDESKCILCTRCIRMCENVQGLGVLSLVGDKMSAFSDDLTKTDCVGCGQCTFVCPTGAISLRTDVPLVSDWIKGRAGNDEYVLVAQTAPAVRVTIAEDLNLRAGDLTEGQMVAGLRALGFDHVFDTNFTADLTIMEEGHELIERVGKGGPFPMFTSCCPGWINLAETQYPEFLSNLSTCKSPQQMMGSLVKDYWAGKVGIDKEKVRVVSIMPCTAKKDECTREQMFGDVDVVLTTRELAQLFKLNRIDVGSLESELYDDPLGEGTGAAVIFGATGGVMEAAVRTAYEVLTGEELADLDFAPARGLEGIKEATIPIGDLEVNVAIAHSGAKIHELLDGIKRGERDYHLFAVFFFYMYSIFSVEIMMCPGGCIGGGGNPKIKVDESPLTGRVDAIYSLDANAPKRKSHTNVSVQKLYDDFLGQPLSHRSHDLLHTTYMSRRRW